MCALTRLPAPRYTASPDEAESRQDELDFYSPWSTQCWYWQSMGWLYGCTAWPGTAFRRYRRARERIRSTGPACPPARRPVGSRSRGYQPPPPRSSSARLSTTTIATDSYHIPRDPSSKRGPILLRSFSLLSLLSLPLLITCALSASAATCLTPCSHCRDPLPVHSLQRFFRTSHPATRRQLGFKSSLKGKVSTPLFSSGSAA